MAQSSAAPQLKFQTNYIFKVSINYCFFYYTMEITDVKNVDVEN